MFLGACPFGLVDFKVQVLARGIPGAPHVTEALTLGHFVSHLDRAGAGTHMGIHRLVVYPVDFMLDEYDFPIGGGIIGFGDSSRSGCLDGNRSALGDIDPVVVGATGWAEPGGIRPISRFDKSAGGRSLGDQSLRHPCEGKPQNQRQTHEYLGHSFHFSLSFTVGYGTVKPDCSPISEYHLFSVIMYEY